MLLHRTKADVCCTAIFKRITELVELKEGNAREAADIRLFCDNDRRWEEESSGKWKDPKK